jgi:hypothetical protein
LRGMYLATLDFRFHRATPFAVPRAARLRVSPTVSPLASSPFDATYNCDNKDG